ncbi:MAG TPA: hypothetical protein PLR99_27190 [Polyangiaceae bacterium]|nr:hypothetical protein [Polyangiaceae bacterium]
MGAPLRLSARVRATSPRRPARAWAAMPALLALAMACGAPRDDGAGQRGALADAGPDVAAAAVGPPGLLSPFGVFGLYEFMLDGVPAGVSRTTAADHFTALGAKWVQEMPTELSALPPRAAGYTRIGKEGAYNHGGDLTAYRAALQTFVAQNKERVKLYEVDTEPSGAPAPVGWANDPTGYVALLRASYETVKAECADCKVVLGGVPGIGVAPTATDPHATFLKAILAQGAGSYFDVFEFKQHHYAPKDYVMLKARYAIFREILASHGVDIDARQVFLESAAYDGQPSYSAGPLAGVSFPAQTESQQASALVKLLVYALSLGVDRIFWNSIFERHDFAGSAGDSFNFYGLVNNAKNPDGKSNVKCAYYTYQRLVALLDDCDAGSITTLRDPSAGAVALVKLRRAGREVWVAWNDGADVTDVALSDVSSKVTITDMAPSVASCPGSPPTFVTSTAEPVAGIVTVRVAPDHPVVVVR